MGALALAHVPSGVPPGSASGAALAATAGPAADLAAGEWAAHLVQSVQVGLDRVGQAEVRFGVAAGPLQGLEVLLRATPGGIEARFVADDAATRRALVEPLLELQRTLADRGIAVASLEVAVRADVGGHGAPDGRASAGAAPAPRAGRRASDGAGSGVIGLPPLATGSPTDWVA